MDAERVRRSRALARFVNVRALGPWVVALVVPWFLLPLRLPEAHAIWMLLGVLALVAEMGSLRERTSTIRFAVPILAVVWWQFGALAAWMTDIATLLAAAAGMGALSARKDQPPGLSRPILEASAASVCAGLAGNWILGLSPGWEANSVTGPAAFVTAYILISPMMASAFRSRTKSFRIENLLPGTLVVTLFYCLSVAGVVLVHDQAAAWTPLLLAPIVACRMLLLSRRRMSEANMNTVDTLAAMLQRAHPYTHRHLERVAEISEEVALRLGLSAPRARLVHQAALLHDIGKIAIDEDILDLPRKLTEDELDHVKKHAEYGGEILAQVDDMREVSRWIRHHHERPDGRGYPEGLLDPEIPLESKIIAAVDAFDAMTGGMEGRDGRPFREPMSVDAALAELDRCAGSQFDTDVVRAFREVVGGTV